MWCCYIVCFLWNVGSQALFLQFHQKKNCNKGKWRWEEEKKQWLREKSVCFLRKEQKKEKECVVEICVCYRENEKKREHAVEKYVVSVFQTEKRSEKREWCVKSSLFHIWNLETGEWKVEKKGKNANKSLSIVTLICERRQKLEWWESLKRLSFIWLLKESFVQKKKEWLWETMERKKEERETWSHCLRGGEWEERVKPWIEQSKPKNKWEKANLFVFSQISFDRKQERILEGREWDVVYDVWWGWERVCLFLETALHSLFLLETGRETRMDVKMQSAWLWR
jgi:hypothetical protein